MTLYVFGSCFVWPNYHHNSWNGIAGIIGPLPLSYEKDEQQGVPSEAIIIRFGENFMAHNNLDLEI